MLGGRGGGCSRHRGDEMGAGGLFCSGPTALYQECLSFKTMYFLLHCLASSSLRAQGQDLKVNIPILQISALRLPEGRDLLTEWIIK